MPKRTLPLILILFVLIVVACAPAAPAGSGQATPSSAPPLLQYPGSAVTGQQTLDKIDVLLIADASTYTGSNWKTLFDAEAKRLVNDAFPTDYQNLSDLFRFYLAQERGRFSAPCGLRLVDANPNSTLGVIAPSMEIAAVIHRNSSQDCSTGNKFSAETGQPLTFLHELGHAALALADEYGVGNDESISTGGYWRPSNGPSNIYRILSGGDECPGISSNMGWPQADCKPIPGLSVNLGRWSRSHTALKNLMRIAGSATPSSFNVAIVRGIWTRLQWALGKCASSLCGSIGFGAGQSMGGHEPIFVEGQEEDQQDNEALLPPRSLLLVLLFSGTEIEVLEQRIIDGPVRGYLVQSVPQIQIEVGNLESDQLPQRYYIWDPRIGLVENDNEDPMSGEVVSMNPVIFDIVVPLDESSRPRTVRLRYPAEPTLYPGWEEDPGGIDFRETIIPIAEPGPLTLVVGWPRQFFTLNPFVMGTASVASPEPESFTEGLIVTTQILEGLTQVAPGDPIPVFDGFPTVPGRDILAFGNADFRDIIDVPLLAESYDINEDATVWTFHLREGVFFHDGIPLTSDAVEANFRGWLEAGYWSVLFFDNQPQFLIIDDLTFQLVFDAPKLQAAKILALPYFAINSPAALEEFGDAYGSPGVGVVGTGPFRYGGAEGNRLLLTRFDNYWGTPAETEAVIFRYMNNREERLRALLDEQSVDLMAGLPSPEIAGGRIQILSDFYRYPEEPILAAQTWVTGWQPSPFYLELFAPIRLNR